MKRMPYNVLADPSVNKMELYKIYYSHVPKMAFELQDNYGFSVEMRRKFLGWRYAFNIRSIRFY